MDTLISVIVPVYNVKPYLRQCIESLTHQTYRNLEIILVDDGSTDGSGELCEKIAQTDSRIVVLHKENAGLGMARNTGLDAAKGEYVMFIDSDDFTDTHMVEKLHEQLALNDADTSYCGYAEYFDDDHTVNKPAIYDHRVFRGDTIIHSVLLNMIAGEPSDKEEIPLSVSVWHALYSMRIITDYGIRFPSERQYISEDVIFDIAYLRRAQTVCYIRDCLYYYRQARPGSLTQKYDEDGIVKQKILFGKIISDLGEFLNENQYLYRVQRMFLGRVRYCMTLAVSYKKTHAGFDLYGTVRKAIEDDVVRQVISSYPYEKNPLQLRVMNFCIDKKLTHIIIALIKLKQTGKHKRF
ncbi:glycosyltransferase family 2 protein [Bifidobacterium callimiconis]|uniref:EpsN n=1 Tax=Bifidobacterium callimiconis TaxID=2306973 RepID=A0A430FBI3_9BIFI|nr:glycosyltransferase [Bifidobacterium callimiconis]RSX50197.1 EpsN [Bifidobacterium callimiconis]